MDKEMTVSKTNPSDLKIVSFGLSTDWEDWLEQNHDDLKGIWLRLYKKGSGIASINHSGALDVALCYGWIDEANYLAAPNSQKTRNKRKAFENNH